MRDEILKRLDELMTYARCQNITSQQFHDRWQNLRDKLTAERCETCLHWTAKLPDGENRPGTCCGWETGMFSIESADECDTGVFWTWSDFGCKCFKPKTREADDA